MYTLYQAHYMYAVHCHRQALHIITYHIIYGINDIPYMLHQTHYMHAVHSNGQALYIT
jgi:hypothetical protein